MASFTLVVTLDLAGAGFCRARDPLHIHTFKANCETVFTLEASSGTECDFQIGQADLVWVGRLVRVSCRLPQAVTDWLMTE